MQSTTAGLSEPTPYELTTGLLMAKQFAVIELCSMGVRKSRWPDKSASITMA